MPILPGAKLRNAILNSIDGKVEKLLFGQQSITSKLDCMASEAIIDAGKPITPGVLVPESESNKLYDLISAQMDLIARISTNFENIEKRVYSLEGRSTSAESKLTGALQQIAEQVKRSTSVESNLTEAFEGIANQIKRSTEVESKLTEAFERIGSKVKAIDSNRLKAFEDAIKQVESTTEKTNVLLREVKNIGHSFTKSFEELLSNTKLINESRNACFEKLLSNIRLINKGKKTADVRTKDHLVLEKITSYLSKCDKRIAEIEKKDSKNGSLLEFYRKRCEAYKQKKGDYKIGKVQERPFVFGGQVHLPAQFPLVFGDYADLSQVLDFHSDLEKNGFLVRDMRHHNLDGSFVCNGYQCHEFSSFEQFRELQEATEGKGFIKITDIRKWNFDGSFCHQVWGMFNSIRELTKLAEIINSRKKIDIRLLKHHERNGSFAIGCSKFENIPQLQEFCDFVETDPLMCTSLSNPSLGQNKFCVYRLPNGGITIDGQDPWCLLSFKSIEQCKSMIAILGGSVRNLCEKLRSASEDGTFSIYKEKENSFSSVSQLQSLLDVFGGFNQLPEDHQLDGSFTVTRKSGERKFSRGDCGRFSSVAQIKELIDISGSISNVYHYIRHHKLNGSFYLFPNKVGKYRKFRDAMEVRSLIETCGSFNKVLDRIRRS